MMKTGGFVLYSKGGTEAEFETRVVTLFIVLKATISAV